jgi:uncharacterized protein YegP (UPF0339 family)
MTRPSRIAITTLFTCALVGGAATALRTSAAPSGATAADEKVMAKFEVYKDKAGEFRWRLRATNTQILATSSDGYAAKRDCLHAIDSIKRAAANAPVEYTTETHAQPQGDQGKGSSQAKDDQGGATNAQRKK